MYENAWMTVREDTVRRPDGRDTTGDQLALATAELAEETGLHAEAMQHLGHLLEAYGCSTQGFDVFWLPVSRRIGHAGKPPSGT